MGMWENELRYLKLEAAIKRAIYRSKGRITARSIAERIMTRSPNKALYSEDQAIKMAGEILRRKFGA